MLLTFEREMTFKASRVRNFPESPPATLIKPVKRFPPSELVDVIVTEITLWEVDFDVGGCFSWSYWKSVFNMKKDYNIILHQIDPLTKETRTFLLHCTDKLEKSQEAFERVCSTLTPLVDDCTLLLTEKLLENIILPEPVEPSMLAHHLTKVMEQHPGAHPDWVKVLRALVLAAVGLEEGNSKDETDQGIRSVLSHASFEEIIKGEDREGNTVLHLAKSAKNVQHVIEAAEKMDKRGKMELVNQRNKEGKAPLHSAFQQNKQAVVRKLLHAGADLHAAVEDEVGSNPFHLAAENDSAESIATAHHQKECFLKRESLKDPEKLMFLNSLNTFNKRGFTPLMLAVCNGNINSAVTLLQAGADPDIQHCTSGDTALHYAARGGHVSLLKTLLAFGAEVKVNTANSTPLDVAHVTQSNGAIKCAEILKEMIKLKKEANSQVSDRFEPIHVPLNSIFLLSMDGGGTRGLLLTQTLLHIQKRMKELKPDCGPVHTYFDYVAGTSAGGLVTLSLVCANATIEATRASLFKAADEICSRKPTVPEKVCSRTAQQTYGKDSVMTDIEKPRVIVPTVLADRNPPELHLIRNYGEAKNEQKPPNEWRVWEAGRSTSAAPFYFPPYEEKFVDGGIMSNNPTLDAMAEIVMQEEEEGTGHKLAMIVSIGTGYSSMPAKVKDVGICVPRLSHVFTDLPHLPSAVTNFFHLLIAQATESNGQEKIRAEAWCKSLRIPYYRLSTPLDKITDLTESDKEILTDMMFQCDKYLLKERTREIDEIARYLLSR